MEKKQDKKYTLLKAIGICFLVFIVLSWIIPTGYFSGGSFVKGETAPLGFFDILRYPIITLSSSVFILNAIVILFIGGLYGVLNKTGVYGKFVTTIAKKFKGKEQWFLVISILVFTILTSLTALTLPLFVLVPFFVAVILTLGYRKITALVATVGAILVGNMGSTYGFNVNGYVSYFFGTDINKMIWYRVLLFVLLVGVLIYMTIKMSRLSKTEVKAKKTTKPRKGKEEIEEIKEEIPFLTVEEGKKKSAMPMVIVMILLVIVSLVGMFNWANTNPNFTFFNDIHEAIQDFKIGGYALFKNIIGAIDPIGYWSNYEFSILLVLASLLVGWIYSVKFKDMVKAFFDGTKKMLPVALYAMIASIVFLLMNRDGSNNSSIFATITNGILGWTNAYELNNLVNVGMHGVLATLGGFFFNDFPYLLNAIASQVGSLYKDTTLIGLIYQGFHGLVMLIAPTSVVLVAGLKYLEIPYTEWLKNIWKYLLAAFVILLIVLVIVLLLI